MPSALLHNEFANHPVITRLEFGFDNPGMLAVESGVSRRRHGIGSGMILAIDVCCYTCADFMRCDMAGWGGRNLLRNTEHNGDKRKDDAFL